MQPITVKGQRVNRPNCRYGQIGIKMRKQIAASGWFPLNIQKAGINGNQAQPVASGKMQSQGFGQLISGRKMDKAIFHINLCAGKTA